MTVAYHFVLDIAVCQSYK